MGSSAFPGWRQRKMLRAETKICTKQAAGHGLNNLPCMGWLLQGMEKAWGEPWALLLSFAEHGASGSEGGDAETTVGSCLLAPSPAGLRADRGVGSAPCARVQSFPHHQLPLPVCKNKSSWRLPQLDTWQLPGCLTRHISSVVV